MPVDNRINTSMWVERKLEPLKDWQLSTVSPLPSITTARTTA